MECIIISVYQYVNNHIWKWDFKNIDVSDVKTEYGLIDYNEYIYMFIFDYLKYAIATLLADNFAHFDHLFQ